MNIKTVTDRQRGCGWRKSGGIYLMGGAGSSFGCCKLPLELTVCYCCGSGIKPTRGFTWINSDLFNSVECTNPRPSVEKACPMNWKNTRMGLLWIGEMFYKSTQHFNREADAVGISRRIAQIPHDVKIGETWIALAHRKAIQKIEVGSDPVFVPGIFRMFKLQSIEYVVADNDSTEKLQRLEKQGVTLVKVQKDVTQPEINTDTE